MRSCLEAAVKNVTFGKNVTYVEPVNLYDCKIGNNVFIGPFVEIQKGVVVGNDVRIQSHTFICEFVTIDDAAFIGHGVMFVNDKFSKGAPARGDQSLWGEVKIGKDVSIGSSSTILPVTICDGCVIGAGSVVTKNLERRGVYAGNPAKLIRAL